MASWTPKVDNVDTVLAAHINLLQTLKQDIDGAIALTGTDQWDKAVDVVAVATLPLLAAGNYYVVTGNTGITAISHTQSQPGTIVFLKFSGTPTLTHHATNLILPGGIDITADAGAIGAFIHDDTGNKWRLVSWQRGEGLVTNSKLSAFLAYSDTTQSQATGDGTEVTMICGVEVTDQLGEYNIATGIFTSTSGGNYAFNVGVSLDDLDADTFEELVIIIKTTNTEFILLQCNPEQLRELTTGGKAIFRSGVGPVPMSAGHTAYVTVMVRNGTKTVDITAGQGETEFGGWQVF